MQHTAVTESVNKLSGVANTPAIATSAGAADAGKAVKADPDGRLENTFREATTGDVTSPAGSGALTIAPNAVTLAKMAKMSTNGFIGNSTGASNDPQKMSGATATALLSASSQSAKGIIEIATTVEMDAGNDDTRAITPLKLAGMMQRVIKQLDNDEMLALRATPINVLLTPGADKAIVVHSAHFVCDSALGAYTEPDTNNIELRYAGSTVLMTIEATGLVTTGDVQARNQRAAVAVATPIANAAVELFQNGGAEFGGGNSANTFSIIVFYTEVSTIAFQF